MGMAVGRGRACVAIGSLGLLFASVPPARADDPTEREVARAVAQTEARAKRLPSVIGKLRTLAEAPEPPGLTPRQQKDWQGQTRWLESVVARFDEAHADHSGILGGGSTFGSVSGGGASMVENMMAANLEFLALQKAIVGESRKFQILSKASQARHEAALDSITNLK